LGVVIICTKQEQNSELHNPGAHKKTTKQKTELENARNLIV